MDNKFSSLFLNLIIHDFELVIHFLILHLIDLFFKFEFFKYAVSWINILYLTDCFSVYTFVYFW